MAKGNRLTPYFMILVFLGPIVVAHLLYYFRHHIHFPSMLSGELLNPPLSIQSLLPEFKLNGKWQLITIQPETCNKHCEEQFNLLNNIHQALGKDKYKLERKTMMPHEVSKTLRQKSFFIVDPKGWVILSYTLPFNPKGVLEDIRRLLRFSHAG